MKTFPCRSLLAGLAAMTAAHLFTSSAWAEEDYERKAKEWLLKADWDKVSEVSREWKRSDANAAIAGWLMGYAGLAMGDYLSPMEEFSRLGQSETAKRLSDWGEMFSKQNPRSAVAQMLRGDALARADKHNEALSALDKAVQLDPQSALLHDVRGLVRVLADMPSDAVDDFEKAIELDPKFADALANLGIVRLAEGDLIGALNCLNQAIDACPNFALAYNARGVVYADLKAWEQSETDFQKAKELSPGIECVPGNLKLVAWAKGQEQFRASRMGGGHGDGRGTTLLASAYDRYSVNIGDGRMVDVINIKNVPQTGTLAGMEATFRQITDQLRNEAKLPADWRPDVLFAQPGLGSSAYAERRNFAKMAFNSGKDLVVSIDMTDRFQWGIAAPKIDEDVSRRFERVIVAANHVWGEPPDAVFESQGTRLLASGPFGSTTLSRLHAQDKLHSDFRLNKVVSIGVPLPGMRMDEGFRRSRVGDAMAIVTRQTGLGLIESEPLGGASSIEVCQRNNKPPSHGSLFQDQWTGKQPNPIPELVGLYMRGTTVSAIQKHANELRDKVPVYTSFASDPTTVHLTVASMTRKGLTDPTRDAVLIGCKDAKIGEMMKMQYGDSWRVEVIPETDPLRLQRIALELDFTRINCVADQSFASSADSLPEGLSSSTAWTLPEVRSFAKGLDLYAKGTKILCDVARLKGLTNGMPGVPAAELTLTFAPPMFEDMQSMRRGQFSPWVSKSLERFGEWGLASRPDLVPPGTVDLIKGLASQVGRGSPRPSLEEKIHYYDAFGKFTIFTAVTLYSTRPELGALAAKSAGWTVDVIDEYGIKPHLGMKYGQPQVDAYRFNANQLAKRGMEVPTMTAYFGRAGVDPVTELHISPRTIAENDIWAKAMNASRSDTASPTISKLPGTLIRNIPVITTPRQDEIWKRCLSGPFPPDKFGRAGVPRTDYRLPSTFSQGDKRGGVAMATEVVKKEKADMSGMFGSDQSDEEPESIPQRGLFCPFLLFCGMSAEE